MNRPPTTTTRAPLTTIANPSPHKTTLKLYLYSTSILFTLLTYSITCCIIRMHGAPPCTQPTGPAPREKHRAGFSFLLSPSYHRNHEQASDKPPPCNCLARPARPAAHARSGRRSKSPDHTVEPAASGRCSALLRSARWRPFRRRTAAAAEAEGRFLSSGPTILSSLAAFGSDWISRRPSTQLFFLAQLMAALFLPQKVPPSPTSPTKRRINVQPFSFLPLS